MRLLFASTGGMGHFNPLVPLIDAAIARGDEVLAVGPPKLEPTLAARGHAARPISRLSAISPPTSTSSRGYRRTTC